MLGSTFADIETNQSTSDAQLHTEELVRLIFSDANLTIVLKGPKRD